jgi:LmbE family N-acetylglucosaminyl deacetylase
VEVSAANFAADRMIEISESRWPELSANADLLTAVVVHEYLGALRGLDRYYESSAGFFARLKAERDSGAFRRELRTRLQGGVDAMLEIFNPPLDEMKLTLNTLTTTSDYERCVLNPKRLGDKDRTEYCLSVARSMERVAKGIDFKQTDGYRKILERERAAEQALNTWIDALGIPERALTQAVDDVVRTLQPTIVYTHHWGDLNADHRAVAQAVAVATRPGGSVRRVLCCEIPSSTEWAPNGDFRPSYFVDTSAVLSRKLRAMAHYASELRPAPHPRNLAALRARARYWGQVAGVLFAEPFVLVREVL